MQDEQILVRRAQQRDQEAFAQLHEEHFDKIYRYVPFKIGNEIEAEDMTQQVFLNALKSISSFKWKGIPFSAWLFRIAHNVSVDHLRRRGRIATVPINGVTVEAGEDTVAMAEKSIEMERIKEYAWCCGAGGGVKEAYPDFNTFTAQERIEEARATGAEALVTACPWCERNFLDTLNGDKMKVYDIVELVQQAI